MRNLKSNKSSLTLQKIVINFCIIIINSYYDFVIIAWNNYISNKYLLEVWDKEENVAVTVAASASSFNRRL